MLAASAVAAENLGNITIDSITVVGTRTENNISNVPAMVSKVDKSEIDDRQAKSVSEIMNQLPGVNFGGVRGTSGQLPTIRGYSDSRINLSIDGAKIDDQMGVGILSSLLIDPDMLESIEVVNGSSSSLYGSGGLGGVMSLRTLSALNQLKTGESFGGNVKLGGATADKSNHVYASVYGRNGAFDGLVAATVRRWGELRQPNGGVLKPNDGDSYSALAKIGYQIGDKARIELSHNEYNEEVLRPNNPEGNNNFTTIQNNTVKQKQDVIHFNTMSTQGEHAIDARVYHTTTERSADKTSTLPDSYSKTDIIGGGAQHTFYLANNRLTYGADGYKETQNATSAGAANTVNPDGTQSVAGIFAQDEMVLFKDLLLVPNARWDSYATHKKDGSSPDKYNSHVSPKVALRWQALKTLSFYTSYGEAYRAPTLNEMYANLAGSSYFSNFAPNPDLKPETAKTLEFGGSFKKQGLFTNDDYSNFKATVYSERVHDLIDSKVIGTYARSFPFAGFGVRLQSQNVRDAKRWGVEISENYLVNDWEFGATYTKMRVKDADTDQNLFSPPDKLTLLSRYQFNNKLSLMWNGMVVAAQGYDSTTARQRAGWSRHDIFLTWTPNKLTRVDVGVVNLMDRQYATYQASAANTLTYDAGRSFMATLGVKF